MSMRAAFAELKEGQAEPEQIDIEGEGETGKPIPREVQLAAAAKVVAEGKRPKPAQATKPQAKAGRTGKNQNPAYHKLTVYIPQETRKAVGMKLLQDGGLDLSELVEQLLDGWTLGRLNV